MANLTHLLDATQARNGHVDMTDEDEFLEKVEAELRMAGRYANAVAALTTLSDIAGPQDVTFLRRWARPHVEAVAKLVTDRQTALGRTAPPVNPATGTAKT